MNTPTPLPPLARAYHELLIAADAQHPSPSVVTIIPRFGSHKAIILSKAVLKIAARIAENPEGENIGAFKLALRAHYGADISSVHVVALLFEISDDGIGDVAEAARIPLVIQPDGLLCSAASGFRLYYAIDRWVIQLQPGPWSKLQPWVQRSSWPRKSAAKIPKSGRRTAPSMYLKDSTSRFPDNN